MKLLRFGLPILMLCGIGTGVAGQVPKHVLEFDPGQLQGTWTIVRLESDGEPEPEGHYLGNTLTFDDTKAILRERNVPPIELTATFDPAQAPIAIDLTPTEGPTRGRDLRGIFLLDGDELKLCLSVTGDRPKAFSTRPGDGHEFFILKRGKPGDLLSWKRFEAPKHGFSVRMPGVPEERLRKAQTLDGPVDVTFYVVRSETERCSYMVGVQRWPAPARDGAEMKANINVFRDSLLAESQGELESDREFREGPISGRQVAFTIPVGEGRVGQGRARFFRVGDRLYFLTVVGVEEVATSKNVERFWKSFRATDGLNSPTGRDAPRDPNRKPPEYPGILLEIFRGPTDRVLCVAIAPDGGTVAAGDQGRTVHLWDTAERQERLVLKHSEAVRSLAFAGGRLAAGGDDGRVILWNARTGAALTEFKGPDVPALQVSFAPDGKTLAATFQDKSIRMWNVGTGQEMPVLPDADAGFSRLAFSPDGSRLAAARDDGTVLMWDLDAGKLLTTFTGHVGPVLGLAFSPDGKMLASGSRDKTIRLWDADKGAERATLVGHTDGIYSVTFAPDGESLVAADFNGDMKSWDVERANVRATLGRVKIGNSLRGTPRGQWTLSRDLTRWAVGTGTEVQWLDVSEFTGVP